MCHQQYNQVLKEKCPLLGLLSPHQLPQSQLQYLLSVCQKILQPANQLNKMQTRVTPQNQFHQPQLQYLLLLCPKIHQAADQLNMEVCQRFMKKIQIKAITQSHFLQPQ